MSNKQIIAVCGVNGVLGRNAICGAVSVRGSFCGSAKSTKCAYRSKVSAKQAQVLEALRDGVEFKVSERDHEDEYKRYTFEADADGLRAPLYVSMAIWPLLRKRIVKVDNGRLLRVE